MAGIALGAVLGIGGGLLLALGKPSAETAAATAPPIVIESVTPQLTPPRAAPVPVAAPTPAAVPAPSANGLATATTPATPTAVPPAPATAVAKPVAAAAPAKQAATATNDKMQERLEWLEQDLKTKPPPKPAVKAPTKPRNGAGDVGSGLAF